MKNNKINELVKEKNIVIPMYIYKLKDRFNIDTDTFLFLMYLYNLGSRISFNINNITNEFGCDLPKAMVYITKLEEQHLIAIEVIKNEKNAIEEYLSLEFFHNKLSSFLVEEMNKSNVEEETIYDLIEKAFGRSLSPIDYEIINAWIEGKYGEELIKEAVKEAAFSGVSNLRYIDKILYEWGKKGFKTKEDVEKNKKSFREEKPKTEVFDYDWMEDSLD
jgi:DnaD and phage-associated domain